MLRLLVLLFLLFITTVAYAQDPTPQPADCPTIVKTAISLTGERCEQTEHNQVCYGHLVLDARPRVDLVNFGFNEPGDIVDVVEVQSLRLSALDTATGQWGVVMMQIEAQLAQTEGTPPDVQILLFGDTELNDATRFLPGTMRVTANVRERPSVESPIVVTLEASDKITASGRLPDDSWIRINLSGRSGWVRSDLVDLRGDLKSLTSISTAATRSATDDNLPQFGPMQAFYFHSGVDDAPCAEAPNSGLLIQTPEGVASISIWLDEVVVQMNATAFIEAQPDGNLTINVLNGEAQVTAQGDTRTVVSGMQIDVPLDDSLSAADVPDDPVPYDPTNVQSLPLALLDRPVIPALPRSVTTGVPIAGDWLFHWDVSQLTCPDGTVVPFESTGAASPLHVAEDSLDWNTTHYTQSSPGIYRSSYVDSSGNLHQDTLQVIAPDRIIGEKVLDLVNPACTLNVGFLLQLFSAAD